MAIAGAVGLVKGLGPEPCAAYLEKLISNITKVASGEALCQLAEEDEEEMEEEEEQEVSISLFLHFLIVRVRCSSSPLPLLEGASATSQRWPQGRRCASWQKKTRRSLTKRKSKRRASHYHRTS